MAYTQAQIDALQEALATGVLRVTYEGRTVEYRSLKEMQEVLDAMTGLVAGAVRVRSLRARTRGDKAL